MSVSSEASKVSDVMTGTESAKSSPSSNVIGNKWQPLEQKTPSQLHLQRQQAAELFTAKTNVAKQSERNNRSDSDNSGSGGSTTPTSPTSPGAATAASATTGSNTSVSKALTESAEYFSNGDNKKSVSPKIGREMERTRFYPPNWSFWYPPIWGVSTAGPVTQSQPLPPFTSTPSFNPNHHGGGAFANGNSISSNGVWAPNFTWPYTWAAHNAPPSPATGPCGLWAANFAHQFAPPPPPFAQSQIRPTPGTLATSSTGTTSGHNLRGQLSSLLAFLDANPDIDYALGTLIYRFTESLNIAASVPHPTYVPSYPFPLPQSPAQPPPPPPPAPYFYHSMAPSSFMPMFAGCGGGRACHQNINHNDVERPMFAENETDDCNFPPVPNGNSNNNNNDSSCSTMNRNKTNDNNIATATTTTTTTTNANNNRNSKNNRKRIFYGRKGKKTISISSDFVPAAPGGVLSEAAVARSEISNSSSAATSHTTVETKKSEKQQQQQPKNN